jgi:hypothetical protein
LFFVMSHTFECTEADLVSRSARWMFAGREPRFFWWSSDAYGHQRHTCETQRHALSLGAIYPASLCDLSDATPRWPRVRYLLQVCISRFVTSPTRHLIGHVCVNCFMYLFSFVHLEFFCRASDDMTDFQMSSL